MPARGHIGDSGILREHNKLQELISWIESGTVEQKANAIVEVEEIGAKQAIPALLLVLNDSDAAIRASAVEALGTLGPLKDKVIGQALLPLLNDSDSLVRANAAEALGVLASSQSRFNLMLVLQSDQDSLVRLCAAEALGRLGQKSALPALVNALSDSDPGVRAYAADSIGILGTSKAERVLLRDKLSTESDLEVKGFILSALERLRNQPSLISPALMPAV